MRRNAPASRGRSGVRETVGQGACEDAPSETRWDKLRVCSSWCHGGHGQGVVGEETQGETRPGKQPDSGSEREKPNGLEMMLRLVRLVGLSIVTGQVEAGVKGGDGTITALS